MKKTKIPMAARFLCIAGILVLTNSVRADLTFDNTIAPIVGTGNTSGAWTTATGNGLALSLRSQYNNTPLAVSLNPSDLTPNNGAGTFTFPVGTATLATWDFWFDVNPGTTDTTGDTFILTVTSSLGGLPAIIPVNLISDNGHNGSEFQNAEDIGFGGANPSLNATYYFNLTAKDASGNTLDSVDMTVINGTPVPEASTVIAGVLLLLPFGVSTFRLLRKTRTA
ncbi:MAG TPA: hypothetical protein VMA13_01290 [Candidatus Saccharimonadales bacterium]|nr:hypothetical protein [Candidatus Saccharimonadales bacterium]